jgi:hypothetical protein
MQTSRQAQRNQSGQPSHAPIDSNLPLAMRAVIAPIGAAPGIG